MEALRELGMIHVKAMAIIVHDGKILATKGYDSIKKENFFRLIGGGVHFQELAEDALKREVKEELGMELENIEFVTTVQNIFTYKDQPGHEVIFLFTAELARKDLYAQEEISILDHLEVKAVWVSKSDVIEGSARLYPAIDYGKILKS